jgi:hypothetical protein
MSLRRSARIAQKASLPIISSVNTDVEEAIKKVCLKKKAIYTPKLIEEYNTWCADPYVYMSIIPDEIEESGWKFVPEKDPIISNTCMNYKNDPDHATSWAKYYSPTLRKQYYINAAKKSMKNYCKKNNLKYDDEMFKEYSYWFASDEKNRTSPGDYETNKHKMFQDSPYTSVNKWFTFMMTE